jgi:hypothetical protein
VRFVRGALLAATAALVAGCAPAPEVVAGSPAPLTPVPTTVTPPATTARPSTSPPAGPTATRPAPVLPAAYETLELAGHGVTVRLPVPAGWTRTRTARGYDLGDPSETLLLRVDVTARSSGQTARQSWASFEPTTARQLAGYRLLGTRDVAGVGESALDWSFTFDGNSGRRQAIDRLLVSGPAGVAVYFSALERDFDRLLPIWTRAKDGLTVS